jgi:CubicO group peptidase (beta-lactamase class C family)
MSWKTGCRLLVAGFLASGLLWCGGCTTPNETVGQQREQVLFWSQAKREADFSHLYTLFPADKVARGERVHPLPEGKPLKPAWRDGTTLADYMATYHIAGVMVVRNGRIRLQRYASNFGPDQHWTSFSVAKSVTSMLLGIALKQGYVKSLDDTLVTYIPELAGSAYADVTVRELLTMTSGVKWDENYTDPDSDVAQMYASVCEDGEPHIIPYLEKLPRAYPHGTHFNYNTAETDLLGVLVQRATHRSLAEYLSRAVWKPYGMAADGYWLKDECSGADTGGSGLSATLADYARIGEFMLGDGRIAGKPIIAQAWLRGATQRHAHAGEPERGYGYLWWLGDDGSYAAIGIFGQLLYIDPSRKLVIVQVGAWPKPDSKAEIHARREFVKAVKRTVDQRVITIDPPRT